MIASEFSVAVRKSGFRVSDKMGFVFEIKVSLLFWSQQPLNPPRAKPTCANRREEEDQEVQMGAARMATPRSTTP